MADTWSRLDRDPGIYKKEGSRGVRYRVTYRDATRRQIVRNFRTLADAREHKRVNSGGDRPDDARASRRTLRELFEAQGAAREYAEETAMVRRYAWAHLEPWADVPIARITPTLVDEILAKVDKPAMRAKVKALLSVMFSFALENRRRWHVVANPVPRAPRRRTRAEKLATRPTEDRKRYLRHDELERLLDALPERYRALVELMTRMGLRPGEAYALTVGKFTPSTQVPQAMPASLLIDTSTTGFTKTGESRLLVLPPVIESVLAHHIEAFSDANDPTALIFTTGDGKPIDDDNFRSRTFARAVRQAGVEGALSPNGCRHTAAAFAISTGANVYDVQRMLGHSKPSITLDVYGALWEEQHSTFIETYGKAIEATRARRGGAGTLARLRTESN
jgi:integrase